jgi:hypothetical protein
VSLFAKVEMRDSPFQPYFNTGTLLDVHTGVYVPGTHGGMVMNGGLTITNAFLGRPKMFKSTEMFSYGVRGMSYYPGSELLVYDTEFSQKKPRISAFSPFGNHADIESRMIITDPAATTAEEFFDSVRKIVDEKMKHRDDYLVESPILDPKTGKPIMILLPTFIAYDSWSKMFSSIMQNTLETKTLGSSDTNMVYMKDGNIKKMIMTQLPTMATRAGICFLLSAHIGDKYEMNPYAPSPKSLQHMRSNEKPKEVGADFTFLISNAIEMRKVELLRDADKKDALYPTDGSTAVELNEVTSILTSCKNSPAGPQLPMVVSQQGGIQSEISNYHYLRENDYYGLLGNKQNHTPAMTDVTLSRTKAREKMRDPKVARALQILAEICYIQNNWITVGAGVDFHMKAELLAEKLLGTDKPAVSDILESRGYWTYEKGNAQPYLSTYDVLAIAQDKYVPKLQPVAPTKVGKKAA